MFHFPVTGIFPTVATLPAKRTVAGDLKVEGEKSRLKQNQKRPIDSIQAHAMARTPWCS